MPKNLKITLRITVIAGIFLVILIGNMWLLDYIIQLANNTEPCSFIDPRNIACLAQPFKGVHASYMHISASLFVFLSILIFKPSKHDQLLIPLLAVTWIILGESVVQILDISTVFRGFLSSRLGVANTLYFLNTPTAVITISFTIITSYLAGKIALIFRKSFI